MKEQFIALDKKQGNLEMKNSKLNWLTVATLIYCSPSFFFF